MYACNQLYKQPKHSRLKVSELRAIYAVPDALEPILCVIHAVPEAMEQPVIQTA